MSEGDENGPFSLCRLLSCTDYWPYKMQPKHALLSSVSKHSRYVSRIMVSWDIIF